METNDQTLIESALIVIFSVCLVLGGCVAIYCTGEERGYIHALDDMRLGKKPRYKLIKTTKVVEEDWEWVPATNRKDRETTNERLEK